MSKRYGCPECGCIDVQVSVETHDTVIFKGSITHFAGSATLDTSTHIKDYCGESETNPVVECMECGHEFDYKEGTLQDD